MALIIKRKTPLVDAEPVQLIAPEPIAPPKPKTVLKFGGAKSATAAEPPKSEELTPRQQKALVDSGLIEKAEVKWEHIMVGDRVKITSTMFYWVKHYKAGDIGTVRHVGNNLDPLGEDHEGHRTFCIDITEPADKSRKGQSCCIFRWEFEKAPS